ncbi:DUF4145 domain-containing protein [Candidatus Saccharibacteria bacterium]|nr:DUF4145 domain-containing protein [Candidatus Saccharibacteria bacterium]
MKKQEYVPAEYAKAEFNCVYCGVFAEQQWASLFATGSQADRPGDVPTFSEHLGNDYAVSKCKHCKKCILWLAKKIIIPKSIPVECPNDDLSDEVKELYNEAALVLADSPRAAAALLRLALQTLLVELGGNAKKTIHENIGEFVKTDKIDARLQKAADSLKVIGNNGAHPGEIDLVAEPEKVEKMFSLINYIADRMITQPKELDEMFNGLPEGAKVAVAKRDATRGEDE